MRYEILIEANSLSHIRDKVRDNINYPSPIRAAGEIMSTSSICVNDGRTTIDEFKNEKNPWYPMHRGTSKLVKLSHIDNESRAMLRNIQIFSHGHNLELTFAGEYETPTVG